MNELVDFGKLGFGNLPYATVFVSILFMLDTAMSSSTAKLYFVCGYFVELLLFYAFGRVCFPPTSQIAAAAESGTQLYMTGGGTKRDTDVFNLMRELARPLQQYTDASFYNFSAGYVMGYWGTMNILLNTPNSSILIMYYLVFLLFTFLYSVFYLSTDTSAVCSWQSGLVSATVGVLGGMLCAQIIHPRVELENGGTVSSGSALPPGVPNGSTSCTSKSSDTICRVFQAGTNQSF